MNALSLRCLLIAVLTVSLSACVPYRFTDAPAVAGQVVSRASGRPVAGAVVSMTSGHASTQTRTDAGGSFRLPALQHVGLLIVGMEGYHPSGDLRVEAAGYHPYSESGLGSPESARGGPTRGFGVIEYGRVGPDLEHIHVTLTPGA